MTGNHLAEQGEEEYAARTTCAECGKGSLSPIEWCDNDHCECTEDCPSFSRNLDCVMKSERLICDNCGHICEAE
jgi:hypothetical protein